MIEALPVLLQYGLPLAGSLVGYIAGRIHQHHINSTAPKPPPIVMGTAPTTKEKP